MGFFYVSRNVVLGLCLVLTLPSLGLLGHLSQGKQFDTNTRAFEGMGLFISILSLLFLPVMLVLSEFRKNAFVLYIVSELAIIGFLWLFWLIAAILVIEEREIEVPTNDCSSNNIAAEKRQPCNELLAIQGLSITIFVFLLFYLLVLLVYAFVKHSQGHLVWTRSVKELQVSLPKVKLSHEAGELDAQGNPIKEQNSSLFGAPNTYPPTRNVEAYPQQQQQQQQHYPQPTYAGTGSGLASTPQPQPVQTHSTGGSQVKQSISYSTYPPGGQYPPPQAPSQTSMYPNAVTQQHHANGYGTLHVAQV